LQTGGEVLGRAAGRHLDRPPALQGWQEHAQGARPFPTVCVVVAHRPAWSYRPWRSDLTDQLVGAFFTTDHGIARVVGLSLQV
jgi:hypothetical protein